jgi:hypothetical protein
MSAVAANDFVRILLLPARIRSIKMQVFQWQRLNFLVVYSACKEKRRKSDYDWTPQNGVMRAKSFRYLLRGFPRAVLLSD